MMDRQGLQECGFALDEMDAIDWLRLLPCASVDLVVTDPAYESIEKHRAQGTTTRLTKEWFPCFPDARLPQLAEELYRVLARGRHAYLFCDDDTSDKLKPLLLAAGFWRVKRLVWDKRKMGMGYRYRARYEFILFAEKRPRRGLAGTMPDVLVEWPRLKGVSYYPTEKPVGLCASLIRQSSDPGDLVIDPFFGSGAIGEAALREGRLFWGCDLSSKALGPAHCRLLKALVPCVRAEVLPEDSHGEG